MKIRLKHCCDDLWNAINLENDMKIFSSILPIDDENNDSEFRIYLALKKTPSFPLNHCPFCGDKIIFEEVKE